MDGDSIRVDFAPCRLARLTTFNFHVHTAHARSIFSGRHIGSASRPCFPKPVNLSLFLRPIVAGAVCPQNCLNPRSSLLIRYRKTGEGKVVARALVYTAEEHAIDSTKVDHDARRIVERLRENGHEAYIVGGAVRDLLLGRTPKDFDIVTDAEPARIKRVFRNARVIGRRFRLVHVYAGPKIFEVSTFRSIANGTIGNEYGSIDEDALRRDFTCNALYYDPIQQQLVDYVDGFKHVKAKKIVPVIPLKTIFVEDPVRMIRCLKYSATTGFGVPLRTRWAIKRDAELLAEASSSRLTEEFLKILASGKSAEILARLEDFGLLRHIVPVCSEFIAKDPRNHAALKASLVELDALDAAAAGRERRLSLLISHFLRPWLESLTGVIEDRPEAFQDALQQARSFLAPLNLPRVELEAAVLVLFKKRGLSPLEKPKRSGPDRGRGPAERGRGGRSPGHGNLVREAARDAPRDSGRDGAETADSDLDSGDSPRGQGAEEQSPANAAPRARKRRRGPRKAGSASSPGDAPSPGAANAASASAGAANAASPPHSSRQPSSQRPLFREGPAQDNHEGKGASPPAGEEGNLSRTSGAARRRRKKQRKSPDSPPEGPAS